MTSVLPPVAELAPDAPAEADEGRMPRGTTTIAPQVFERLAVRAATDVPGVEGEVRTGLARLVPWMTGATADASADLDDGDVLVELTFNVAYPASVRQVADAVRARVAERITTLTGRRVAEINITVPELVVPERRRPRVR